MKSNFFILMLLLLNLQIISAQDGDILYDNSIVHTLEIISNEPTGTLVNTLNQMRIADVQAVSNITEIDWNYLMVKAYFDGELVDSVGLRMKCGDVSCSIEKPSLKLDMNEFVSGKKYDGLKKMNIDNCIHDPSLIREKLGYDLFKDCGACSRRTSFVNVVLDGEDYGTYVYIEQVNKDYLNRCYGNKDGNLFKFNGGGGLQLQGNNTVQNYNDVVDLKTNTTANDWSDLLLLIDKVNNTDATQYKDTISQYINVDAVLTYLAVSNYIVYADNLFSGGNNGYWYHNTTSNKWEIIPHDLDLSFFAEDLLGYSYSPENTQFINPVNFNTEYPDVFTRILQVPEYLEKYYEKCCFISQNLGQEDNLKAKVDFYISILDNASVLPNSNMEYTNFSDPNDVFIQGYNFYGIKDFAEKRQIKFLANFDEVNFECNATTSIEEIPSSSLIYYPNPTLNEINIESNTNSLINLVQIYDLNGKLLLHKKYNQMNHVLISTDFLIRGVFIVRVNNSSETKLVKL